MGMGVGWQETHNFITFTAFEVTSSSLLVARPTPVVDFAPVFVIFHFRHV